MPDEDVPSRRRTTLAADGAKTAALSSGNAAEDAEVVDGSEAAVCVAEEVRSTAKAPTPFQTAGFSACSRCNDSLCARAAGRWREGHARACVHACGRMLPNCLPNCRLSVHV